MTISFAPVVISLGLMMALPVMAQDASSTSASSPASGNIAAQAIPCQTHDEAQEKADGEVAGKAIGLMGRHDLPGLDALMPDLQAAAGRSPDKVSLPEKCGDTLVIYSADTLATLLTAAESKNAGTQSVAVRQPLPYARLNWIIGWVYFEKQNIEKATRYYARGMLNDPHDPLLVPEYANALEETGHSDQALVVLDTYLASHPTLPKTMQALVLRRRAYALGELKRYDEAIAGYNESLTYAPGNATALNEIQYNTKQKALHPN